MTASASLVLCRSSEFKITLRYERQRGPGGKILIILTTSLPTKPRSHTWCLQPLHQTETQLKQLRPDLMSQINLGFIFKTRTDRDSNTEFRRVLELKTIHSVLCRSSLPGVSAPPPAPVCFLWEFFCLLSAAVL